MSKLNRDILYLIVEELQHDKNTLSSCLLVNKFWCEIIIPILWQNPWKYLKKGGEKLLLIVILSHLSDKLKEKLKNKGIHFLRNSYKRPLFDYINFCKHLNLNEINSIIINSIYRESKRPIVK